MKIETNVCDTDMSDGALFKDKRPKKNFFLGLFFALLATGVVSFLSGGVYHYLSLSLVAACILCLYLALINENNYFHPLSLLLCSLLIGSVGRIAFIASTVEGDRHPLLLNKDVSILMPACFVLVLAMFFLALGDFCFRNYSMKSKGLRHEINNGKVRLLLLFFFTVAACCIGLYVSTLGVAEIIKRPTMHRDNEIYGGVVSSGYVLLGSTLMQVVTFVYYSLKKAQLNSFREKATFALLALSSIIVPFLASTRASIAFFVLSLFVINAYHKNFNINFNKIFKVFFLVLFVLVLIGQLRVYSQKSGSDSAERRGVVESILKETVSGRHFLGADKIALIMDYYPKHEGYLMGRSLLLWVIAPVPRAIWEDKPTIRVGGDIGHKIFGVPETSGVPPGFTGELYMNGGYVFVCMGFFVLGALCRLCYNSTIRRSEGSVWSPCYYVAFVIPFALLLPSTDLAGAVIKFLCFAVPITVIALVSKVQGSIR